MASRTARWSGRVPDVVTSHEAVGQPEPHRLLPRHPPPAEQQVDRHLRAHLTEPARDVAALFDALAFNWLICNTDAHAKNYSVLLGPNAARLAPLYDIWSVMPNDPHHYEAHT